MKRYYKFTLISTVLIILVFQSGCKKGWLDVNYNPNQLTDNNITPDILLPPLLTDAAVIGSDFEILNMWMGYWAAPSLPTNLNLTNYTDMPGSTSISRILLF